MERIKVTNAGTSVAGIHFSGAIGNMYNSVIEITMSGDIGGIVLDELADFEIYGSLIEGSSKTEGAGIRVYGSQLHIFSEGNEIRNCNYGIMNCRCGVADLWTNNIKNYIHGCTTGILAQYVSVMTNTSSEHVVFGQRLNTTADTNTTNIWADATTYSSIN
jgi:hypothetical protein